jgi:hypothetical protein
MLLRAGGIHDGGEPKDQVNPAAAGGKLRTDACLAQCCAVIQWSSLLGLPPKFVRTCFYIRVNEINWNSQHSRGDEQFPSPFLIEYWRDRVIGWGASASATCRRISAIIVGAGAFGGWAVRHPDVPNLICAGMKVPLSS